MGKVAKQENKHISTSQESTEDCFNKIKDIKINRNDTEKYDALSWEQYYKSQIKTSEIILFMY